MSYTYKSINAATQIRLLRLFQGTLQDPLRGEILQFNLKEGATYTALSYAWGSSKKPFILHTVEGKVPITASLYGALRRVRDETSDGLVWADAICIDQDNDEEKGHQVSIMRDIYATAACVVVYLGEESHDSGLAIDSLRQIFELVRWEVLDSEYQRSESSVKPPDWENGVPIIQPGNLVWLAIQNLFERPWFSRRWTIQEFTVAIDPVFFVCGNRSFSWQILHVAIQKILETINRLNMWNTQFPLYWESLVVPAGLCNLRLMHQKQESIPLRLLLSTFNRNQCIREHDRILSLIGLCEETFDIDWGQVYFSEYSSLCSKIAISLARNGGIEELLPYAGYDEMSPEYCSWIPKWIDNRFWSTISDYNFCQAYRQAHKDESPEKSTLIYAYEPSPVLQVNIISLGPIIEVVKGPAFTLTGWGGEIQQYLEEVYMLLKFFESSSRLASPMPKGRLAELTHLVLTANHTHVKSRTADIELAAYSRFKAAWAYFDAFSGKEEPEPIRLGTTWRGNSVTEWPIYKVDTRTFNDPQLSGHGLPTLPGWGFRETVVLEAESSEPQRSKDIKDIEVLRKQAIEYVEHLHFVQNCLRLGTVGAMANGYVGNFPKLAQPDDFIAIIPGFVTPAVMRFSKHPGYKGHLRFIGEAYVHGLMDGEALFLENNERITVRIH